MPANGRWKLIRRFKELSKLITAHIKEINTASPKSTVGYLKQMVLKGQQVASDIGHFQVLFFHEGNTIQSE
jgi:hypothetical protein